MQSFAISYFQKHQHLKRAWLIFLVERMTQPKACCSWAQGPVSYFLSPLDDCEWSQSALECTPALIFSKRWYCNADGIRPCLSVRFLSLSLSLCALQICLCVHNAVGIQQRKKKKKMKKTKKKKPCHVEEIAMHFNTEPNGAWNGALSSHDSNHMQQRNLLWDHCSACKSSPIQNLLTICIWGEQSFIFCLGWRKKKKKDHWERNHFQAMSKSL